MKEITTKQRAFLRGLANRLEATLQVGKDGWTPQVAESLRLQLEKNELVKGNVLETADQTAREICQLAVEGLDCAPVQVIGRKFVVYRPAKEPVILLPGEKLPKKSQSAKKETGKKKVAVPMKQGTPRGRRG